MIIFTFTKFAEKQFTKQIPNIQERIIKKLQDLKTHPNIFSILKTVHDIEPATHRLRIGNYRILLKLEKSESEKVLLLILDIDHRNKIYIK